MLERRRKKPDYWRRSQRDIHREVFDLVQTPQSLFIVVDRETVDALIDVFATFKFENIFVR